MSSQVDNYWLSFKFVYILLSLNVIRAPANGQHQVKNGYEFTINDRSSFYDWYNAYFKVQFQLQKAADGTAYGTDR